MKDPKTREEALRQLQDPEIVKRLLEEGVRRSIKARARLDSLADLGPNWNVRLD